MISKFYFKREGVPQVQNEDEAEPLLLKETSGDKRNVHDSQINNVQLKVC